MKENNTQPLINNFLLESPILEEEVSGKEEKRNRLNLEGDIEEYEKVANLIGKAYRNRKKVVKEDK